MSIISVSYDSFVFKNGIVEMWEHTSCQMTRQVVNKPTVYPNYLNHCIEGITNSVHMENVCNNPENCDSCLQQAFWVIRMSLFSPLNRFDLT